MEYVEGSRTATVEVDFGKSICVYENRVTGWFIAGNEIPMTVAEKQMVVSRVSAALRFDGNAVEVSGY